MKKLILLKLAEDWVDIYNGSTFGVSSIQDGHHSKAILAKTKMAVTVSWVKPSEVSEKTADKKP